MQLGFGQVFLWKGEEKGMLLGTCSRVVELSLGRRKEQEHAAHFGKREGDKSIDTTKELMSSPKCRSVEVINNPVRPGSNHREFNYINYK
jgi:hypothetical protein